MNKISLLSAILLWPRRNSRMAIAFYVSCVPSNVRFYLLVRRATRYEKRLNRFEFEFELASSTSITLNYARPITYLSCSHTTLYYPLHSNTIPFFLIPDSESFIFFSSFINDQMVCFRCAFSLFICTIVTKNLFLFEPR